jgi:hypothetical protein
MALMVHRRSDARKHSAESFITLRSTGISFNAHFVREAGVESVKRVTFLIDNELRQLGFRFHSNKSQADSFCLTTEGAGKWMQSIGIYKKYPWLDEVIKWSMDSRRFTPRYNPREECWLIEIPTTDTPSSGLASGADAGTRLPAGSVDAEGL